MRNLGETIAAQTPEPTPEEKKWLRAEDVMGFPLQVYQASTGQQTFNGETQNRAYIAYYVVGDDEHNEFHTSFSDKSHAYRQLVAMIAEQARGGSEPQFPVYCSVGRFGEKSYKLVDGPDLTTDRTDYGMMARTLWQLAMRKKAAQRDAEAGVLPL